MGVLTDQVESVTFLALRYPVVRGELPPVLSLIGAQDSGSVTQWTKIVQSREDRLADEVGAIRHALHRLG